MPVNGHAVSSGSALTRPVQRRTNADKVGLVRTILDIYDTNAEDPDGDKHLASRGYAMEAIDAIVNDDMDSPILRMFLDSLPSAR